MTKHIKIAKSLTKIKMKTENINQNYKGISILK